MEKKILLGLMAVAMVSCHRPELPAYYINGMFFRNVEGLPLGALQTKSGALINDLEGNKVYSVQLADGALIPEQMMEARIPDKWVKNREQFVDNAQAFEDIFKMQVAAMKDIDHPRTLKLGQPLPDDFLLRDLGGGEWNKKRLEGHITVINLWFSSCGPCLKEMPILSQWKEQYPDVTFLSVNYEKAEIVKRVVHARGFTWKHLYGDDYFCKYLDNKGFPMFLVLDEQGILRFRDNGASETIRSKVLKCVEELRSK